MTEPTATKPNVLVIASTGKSGRPVCAALVRANFTVFGATRSVPNAGLTAAGVTPVAFQFGDAASAANAIKAAGGAGIMVYIITDFFNAAGGKREVEAAQGIILVDACKAAGVSHIVFQSVVDCDVCPDSVVHFKSKFDIEKHLKASGVQHSIIRPAAFFENFDDDDNHNPLTEGFAKGLWPASATIMFIACADIAAAAVAMFQNPAAWAGKKLDAVTCGLDGKQIAEALTLASGTACEYRIAMPACCIKCCLSDLFHMVEYYVENGVTVDIAAFKQVVPNAMGPLEWFASVGKWANGKKFAPVKTLAEAKPASSGCCC